MSKISAYGAISSVQPNDLLVVVDVDDTTMASTGTTKQMTLSQLPLAAVQVATVTVSPKGTAQGAPLPNNGADFGPDTSGTTTSGLQEALTSIASTGGKVVLRQGAFQINSAMTLTTDYSVTIEGETRGRAENVTSSTSPWGVFLMVNNLASGTVALTINSTTFNLGMLQLFNFTVRGQPLGYTGNSIAGMKFLATGTNGNSPAQIEMDNVACEYLAAPCINIINSNNGPVIIGWIGFFYCGNFEYDTPSLQLQTGTCHIGHIEAFFGGTPPIGVTGSSSTFCFIDIDSIFCGAGRIFNFGCNSTAPSTYLHIGSVGLHNPGGSGLIRLEASSGSLSAHIGKVTWGNGSSQGYIVEGTSQSTSGTVQVTIESLWGNPQYLQWNNSGATVGAGSFLDIMSAYFTVAPTADIPFANMTEAVRTAASSWSGGGGASIDTNAAHIQPDGNQSAGGNGLAADSGHVHPVLTSLPADNGLLMGNYPLDSGTANVTLTAGTLYLLKLPIREALTITNLWFGVNANGSGASTGTFAGLYSSSGTLLSGSSDVATHFTSAGGAQCALTTPQALSAGTFVWAALVVNLATTQPGLIKGVGNGSVANLGLAAATYRFCTNGTGQTSLPATITPSSNTITGSQALWVGAS